MKIDCPELQTLHPAAGRAVQVEQIIEDSGQNPRRGRVQGHKHVDEKSLFMIVKCMVLAYFTFQLSFLTVVAIDTHIPLPFFIREEEKSSSWVNSLFDMCSWQSIISVRA